MLFLGDIHGDTQYLTPHCMPSEFPPGTDFTQVGDMGVGFVDIPVLPNMRFIRGNHDNPELSRQHPCYIGDWKLEGNILYLSGAGSIDKRARTENVDWWAEEELSIAQMNEVLDLDALVQAVVAHDAPLFAYPNIHSHHIFDKFNTPRFLVAVAERFRPKVWVCGHHHVSKRFTQAEIDFHVLGINEFREVSL